MAEAAPTKGKTDWLKGLLSTLGAALLAVAGNLHDGAGKLVCLWVGVVCAMLGAYLIDPKKLNAMQIVQIAASAAAVSRQRDPTLPTSTSEEE